MKKPIHAITKIRSILTTLGFAVVSFGSCPVVQAVSPPPDGGYPGQNTAEGALSLLHLSGGTNNTAVGWASLGFDVSGNLNTAVGAGTLLFNTGDENTAAGGAALLNNMTGFSNTANGAFALFSNSTGSNNTAIGYQALFSNTAGFRNNAFGVLALSTHQTGSFNNAFGSLALMSDLSGSANNAFGDEALHSNTIGTQNTAMGDFALHDNNGDANSAFGAQSLKQNTTGILNTANGNSALFSNTFGSDNTACGVSALHDNTTGSGNIALGAGAGLAVTTADHVICIGSDGANVSNTAWISGIYSTTAISSTTLPVVVSDGGQLGTAPSSRRFKKDIAAMDNASEAVLALKPVKFHYKGDKNNTAQFGLIAEEVAEVNPALVARDKDSKPYSVRYDQVNAMLLNEFLKEHRVVQEQGETIARQQNEIETLAADLKELSSHLKVTKAGHQSASKEHKTRVW